MQTCYDTYLNNAENIFDIMAYAHACISPFSTEKFGESCNCEQQQQDLNIAVSLYCENIKQFGERRAFYQVKKHIALILQALEKDKLKLACYILVTLIDKKCVGTLFYPRPQPGQILPFSSLNSESTKSLCTIVPRLEDTLMSCFNSKLANTPTKVFRTRQADDQESTLYGILKHHIILPNSNNSNAIPLFHIPYNMNEIADSIAERDNQLSIGLFPLTGEDFKTIFNYSTETYYEANNESKQKIFSILGFRNGIEEKIIESYKAAIDICQKAHIHFAVFPELFSSQTILDCIKKYLKEGHFFYPSLIWMGSSWENNINQCTVIDCYGKELFSQQKRQPFKSAEFGIESLAAHNKIVNIIDILNVGRIMTGICKDITDFRLSTVSKELFATFFVLPAYTKSLDLQREAESLSKEWITVICSNACSAISKKTNNDPISFIAITKKVGNKNECRLLNLCREKSCSLCNKCSLNFLRTIDYENIDEHEEAYYSPTVRNSLIGDEDF